MSDLSFDSNILIDSLNGIEAARTEIKRVTRPWISRLTWIEVMSKGNAIAMRRSELFLGAFLIDEVDDAVGRRAASLRRERPKLKLPDAVILASALAHGRMLVTRNTKDFPAGMQGIHIPYTL